MPETLQLNFKWPGIKVRDLILSALSLDLPAPRANVASAWQWLWRLLLAKVLLLTCTFWPLHDTRSRTAGRDVPSADTPTHEPCKTCQRAEVTSPPTICQYFPRVKSKAEQIVFQSRLRHVCSQWSNCRLLLVAALIGEWLEAQ